jgi:PBSX family phage portal protein
MQDNNEDIVNVEIIKSIDRIDSSKGAVLISSEETPVSDNIFPPYNPVNLSQYYQMNSFHQRCVQTKALVTAGLGYEFIAANNNSGKTPSILSGDGNSELDILNKFIEENEKASGETFTELLIKFQTDFEVFGYSFLEVVRDLKGRFSQLYHIPAKHAILRRNENGNIELVQSINDKTRVFAPDEFLVIKNYNPDNRYYGLPEYISSLPAILFDREMMEYNISRIRNNAIPDLIISVSGSQLTQAQKDVMKDFWSNNFKGSNNSGKTLLIETTAKDSQIQVTEIKSTYRDGAFRLAKRECRDEIIACHGVPPILLGIKTSGSIGSGKDISEQLRTFKEIIIEPRQRRIEQLLNTLFKTEFNIRNVQFRLKNINISELANYKEGE